jgi:hypothetical protein
VKTLEARVVAAEIERDQINVILDFTRRDLESKKACIDMAKTEIQEASVESDKAAIETVKSFETQEDSHEIEKAAIDTAKASETQASVSRQHECHLCSDSEVDALFLCGHVACCMSCASKLPGTKEGDELVVHCPLCREEGPFRRIYFA